MNETCLLVVLGDVISVVLSWELREASHALMRQLLSI